MKKAVKEREPLNLVKKVFEELKTEYQKIFDGELPNYFQDSEEKFNKRKIVKNIVMISDIAIQEVIETVAQVFKPDITGTTIFDKFISRKEQSAEVNNKLYKLHQKINDYFNKKGNITQADVLFDLNLFIENDVNYLMFAQWNEFLNYYSNLIKISFSSEFDLNLKSFNNFMASLLKESAGKSK